MKILDPNAPESRRPIRVAVCVPCRDDVKAGFAFDLAAMMTATAAQRRDIELRLYFGRGSILPALRHDLVVQAVQAGMTHVLFLDADMRFPRDLLVALLAHREPIVAVNYPTRTGEPVPTAFAELATLRRVYTEADGEGVQAVEACGFGGILIDADVFAQLPAPWFQFGYNPTARAYVGEDVYFCGKARAAGLAILVDHDASQRVAHIGEWEFRHEHALAYRDMTQDAEGSTRGPTDVQ